MNKNEDKRTPRGGKRFFAKFFLLNKASITRFEYWLRFFHVIVYRLLAACVSRKIPRFLRAKRVKMDLVTVLSSTLAAHSISAIDW